MMGGGVSNFAFRHCHDETHSWLEAKSESHVIRAMACDVQSTLQLDDINNAIDDGGKTYDEWVRNFESKHRRISSHKSNAQQYAIRGSLVKECLFSKKTIIENGEEREVTWVQLERHPVTVRHSLPHLFTWLLYKATGQNQGPLGSSDHTEKHDPIILKTLQ